MSSHDFNTPPEILSLVRLLGPTPEPIQIGLDPCSNTHSLVNAKTSYTEKENGLIQNWRGHGLVFVNPPHSMSPYNIEPWMEKAYKEFGWSIYDDDALVMLVPAKTDTAWFHDYVVAMGGMKCFLRGRPKYWLNGSPTPGPGKFASMILYKGAYLERFVAVFHSQGWLA